MQYRWDPDKNRLLEERRGITFEEIVAALEAGQLLANLQHPARPNQSIYVVLIDGYPWDVPYVRESDGGIFLKTAFPNRKRK